MLVWERDLRVIISRGASRKGGPGHYKDVVAWPFLVLGAGG